MQDIHDTLKERGSRYGAFSSHAEITQALKAAMHAAPNWEHLSADKREALDMVAHKIGRILNGDPEYVDSWVDMVGYTQLVIDELEHGAQMVLPLVEKVPEVPVLAKPADAVASPLGSNLWPKPVVFAHEVASLANQALADVEAVLTAHEATPAETPAP